MIKNVIFDIGRVIVSFEPVQALYDELGDMDEALRLKPIIFSELWGECDYGHITLEEQIELTVQRSPEDEKFIRHFLTTRINMFHLIESTRDVIYDLKKAGVDIYYLSDTSFDVIAGLKEKFEFFEFFKGGVISCAEKAIKRNEDLKIFKVFIDRFGVDPSECVFIDDTEINVINAQKAGFNIIHLTDPSIMRPELLKFQGLEDRL